MYMYVDYGKATKNAQISQQPLVHEIEGTSFLVTGSTESGVLRFDRVLNAEAEQ